MKLFVFIVFVSSLASSLPSHAGLDYFDYTQFNITVEQERGNTICEQGPYQTAFVAQNLFSVNKQRYSYSLDLTLNREFCNKKTDYESNGLDFNLTIDW